MRWRVGLAQFLLRLGSFIQSLALMAMRPDDLIAFSRRIYAKYTAVESWSADRLVDAGLRDEEHYLAEKIPRNSGRLLLLGVGGGREAVWLAKKGFSVTGVDFVAEMVESAKRNASRHNVQIGGIVQEISALEVPDESYDVVWLSSEMYSCIPTSARRLAMLDKIRRTLKEDGYFLCQFRLQSPPERNWILDALRRMFAYLTLGNMSYEIGDGLWGHTEFVHAFPSEEAVRAEITKAGFTVLEMHVPEGNIRAGAVLKKVPSAKPRGS